ncbi:GGDEF domain-containing protein [Gilvimarinus agarilyticus]|uniref:GGDEF domain-containing protein n=1 Tax=Gilvimarinus agarilyticus TaxID=679259 RepID=UPI000698DC47|nr:GGDEF domain-containing protein [Gilvimarinus agarilyticus]
MRDLSSSGGIQALSNGPAVNAAAAELLQSRTKLAHALQTSLDTHTIIRLFFEHAQGMVNFSGLRYCANSGSQEEALQIGRQSTHQCHYTMRLADQRLGELTFYRRQRFSEPEQQTLETLLASLAFPLRNAQQYQDALQLALIDPLTRVGNRTALDNALERERQLLIRNGEPFALILIDIDHFKHINDQHGHRRGDKVICTVAETIDQVSRGTDMTFRYGGEEFALLLSGTGASGALISAERVRRAIEALHITHDEAIIRPTISLGVSACINAEETAGLLVDRADLALYRAKASGRNRSCCEPPVPDLASVVNAGKSQR